MVIMIDISVVESCYYLAQIERVKGSGNDKTNKQSLFRINKPKYIGHFLV